MKKQASYMSVDQATSTVDVEYFPVIDNEAEESKDGGVIHVELTTVISRDQFNELLGLKSDGAEAVK